LAEPRDLREGELVEATVVGNETEGEMIRGLLESAGIPSILQGAGMVATLRHGFPTVPVYGGSQKVMVHANRLADARQVIAATLDAADELS
jgi:hypothetical protein